MVEPKQESTPGLHKMTREEFDLITYQQIDPKPEIARQEKHEVKNFWVLGVPLGLIAAFFLNLATDMGTPAFFLVWAVFALIIDGFFSSISHKKGPF
jgi:hypothetical protein